MMVQVVQRQMAPYVAQVVAEGRQQLADHDLGLAAVRALVVAVLDEGHRRVVGPTDVVAFRIDLVREVEDVLPRARELPRPDLLREAADRAERERAGERGEDRRREHSELRLVELPALEGEARDE